MTYISRSNLHKLVLSIAVTFRSNGYNWHSQASCFCILRLRCAKMFKETEELQAGKIWKEMRGGRESQTFFAAAGDIQAKSTRVSGGFDLLVHIMMGSRKR